MRTGEHVFVWLARFDDQAAPDAYLAGTDPTTTRLLLATTARSLLR